MLKKDRVIVLRLIKHGEADLVVQSINRHGARVSFFAKGGLKSKKRFAGGLLEPTHYIEVTFKERADINDGEPLHTLLEAQLIRGFDGLRKDYDRLQVALYFLRVMSKVAQAGLVDAKDLFDLLGNALQAAESTESIHKLKIHFEMKVLAAQGVLPPLNENWVQVPLRDHSHLELERAEEWEVHHALEDYLGTIS